MNRKAVGVLAVVCLAVGLGLGVRLGAPARVAGTGRPEIRIDMPTGGINPARESVRLRVFRTSGPGGETDYGTANHSPPWVVTVPDRVYYAVRE